MNTACLRQWFVRPDTYAICSLFRFIIQIHCSVRETWSTLLEGHCVKNIALYLFSKYPLLGRYLDQSTSLDVTFVWPSRTVLVSFSSDWLNLASRCAQRRSALADTPQGVTALVTKPGSSPLSQGLQLSQQSWLEWMSLRTTIIVIFCLQCLSGYVHSPQHLTVIAFFPVAFATYPPL